MKKQHDDLENKGFTLVELLVAMLITGILMATITSVFLMSQKIYTRGGDISYKQKSITNVETDLQNALSRATSVTLSNNPNGKYNLGLNADGKCVEVFGGSDQYIIDQISVINLQAVAKGNVYAMNYQLNPRIEDSPMSTLSGGIVMNNIKISGDFASQVVLDQSKKNYYLVVNY